MFSFNLHIPNARTPSFLFYGIATSSLLVFRMCYDFRIAYFTVYAIFYASSTKTAARSGTGRLLLIAKTYFKNPFTIWSSASFSVRLKVISLISCSPENWKLPGRASLFCYNQTLNTIFVPDICIPFLLYVYGADSAPVLECRKDPTDSYLQTRA